MSCRHFFYFSRISKLKLIKLKCIMKLKNLLFLLAILFFLSSFDIESRDVKIKIKNWDERELTQGGIKPSDFTEMTVESLDENLTIESLQITLARGNRAVSISDVNGNKFSLRKLACNARSGDRLVIEVRKRNLEIKSVKPTITVITIPIK